MYVRFRAQRQAGVDPLQSLALRESGHSRVAATGRRNSQQPRENKLQAKPDALLVR